ncbi:hypothetical protein SETIT_2G147700v2 [Setaria italica]|uniref:Uncharacterized protein n=1 Tax=Setaria italica TaxID=4555 RepID=A0A368PZ74_SETIT|nr:hypothetical protein SETIT_2G147700v2 [Setaria italica]
MCRSYMLRDVYFILGSSSLSHLLVHNLLLPRKFGCISVRVLYDHIGRFKMTMFYLHFQLQLDCRRSVKLLTYDVKVTAATSGQHGCNSLSRWATQPHRHNLKCKMDNG